MKKIFTSINLCFFMLCWCNIQAQIPVLQLVQFSTGYTSPVDIENCGDSRLFIVEQAGKIFITDSTGAKIIRPFLDISNRVYSNGNEQGLLGLAFDPNYSTNGYFYINYINKNQNTTIARFKVSTDPNVADRGSETILFHVTQPFANHNGGCLKFGPDGYLYIGLGDGGSGGDPNNNAQNPMSRLGKMLRIDVHHGNPYAIPPTNPFVDSVGYKKEIWALGMRNPWRFSFDSQTGDLWIGDVGQDAWEEIDYQKANDAGGENYGWRCYEGNHPYNLDSCKSKLNYTFPIYNYQHKNGDCAVMGGFVYRGKLYPNMVGKYFYCDYCSGRFKMIYNDGTNWVNKVLLNTDDYSFVSFGVDHNNELYVVNKSTGIIYVLTDISKSLPEKYAINSQPSSINIYPNPSNGKFVVEFISDKNQPCTMKIYNAFGKGIYNSDKSLVKGINTWNINLPQLTKGNYYVKLNDNSALQLSKPIIIE
ncbi:MAG: PQQ-dependent sugar dehydrogenase [Chitinophagaceae bacterium]